MKSMGQKIRLLRISAGLSQEELADQIGVTVKSIQRYETEKSRPDSYILPRLAAFFDVSADYLLGLIGYKEQLEEEAIRLSSNGQRNILYAQYLRCKNNYSIDPNSEYYAISLDDKMTTISAQTQWVGWANEEMTYERRRIRPVIPSKFLQLCKSLRDSIIVINCKEDVDAFLVFGGRALVKTDICKKYLPAFCEDFIVPHHTNQENDQ